MNNFDLDTKISKKQKREEKKALQKQQVKTNNNIKTLKKMFTFLFIFVSIVGSIYFFGSRKFLPPITQQGHIEESPISHIMDTPMDTRIHKHMLEHADGTGAPGIIINYDCLNYLCEDSLIIKLGEIVQRYPENLYLAPYKNMKSKIIISRFGSQERFEEFDEAALVAFIEN